MSEDVYVRNEVFNETMKRIEAMMAASEARTKALIADNNARLEVYRADSQRDAERLVYDIKAINDRFDRMERASARRWTIAGVVIAFFGAALGVVPYVPAIKLALGW